MDPYIRSLWLYRWSVYSIQTLCCFILIVGFLTQTDDHTLYLQQPCLLSHIRIYNKSVLEWEISVSLRYKVFLPSYFRVTAIYCCEHCSVFYLHLQFLSWFFPTVLMLINRELSVLLICFHVVAWGFCKSSFKVWGSSSRHGISNELCSMSLCEDFMSERESNWYLLCSGELLISVSLNFSQILVLIWININC